MAVAAAQKYPYNLTKENFDFCLHAPLQVGEKSLELMEGSNWGLHPGMQFAVKPIQNSATQISEANGRITARFDNPKHLVGYFLGSPRFNFAVDLEAETFKLGREEVYTYPDLFELLGKSSRYMECGQTPHIPTVEGRLMQLAEILNNYKAETVRPGMIEGILNFYAQITAPHEQPFVVVTNEDEGW